MRELSQFIMGMLFQQTSGNISQYPVGSVSAGYVSSTRTRNQWKPVEQQYHKRAVTRYTKQIQPVETCRNQFKFQIRAFPSTWQGSGRHQHLRLRITEALKSYVYQLPANGSQAPATWKELDTMGGRKWCRSSWLIMASSRNHG